MTTWRQDGQSQLSDQVRKAIGGDPESLNEVISWATPIILAHARYRLSRHFGTSCEAEDLVQQVWAVALPRLGDIRPRDGRYSPVLLKFLSTTLLRIYLGMARRHASGKPAEQPVGSVAGSLPDDASAVITRVLRHESEEALTEAIDSMSSEDRELLILRGVEQQGYEDISSKLGVEEDTLRVRYHRALKRLRSVMSPDFVDELPD